MNARAWFYGPEGFGSTRGSLPSSESIVKADRMQAKAARGVCIATLECERLADAEDGTCLFCRKEGQ